MISYTNYDVVEFKFPHRGMNQKIATELLASQNFAPVIRNIIGKPMGNGSVRFGTSDIVNKVLTPSTMVYDDIIMKQFAFSMVDGSKQYIYYVRRLMHDADARSLKRNDAHSVSLRTTNIDRYTVDSYVKVYCKYAGKDINFTARVISVSFDDHVEDWHIMLDYILDDNVTDIISISYSIGKIYCFDVSRNTLTELIIPNGISLSVACIPRSAVFSGVLLICNGIDPVLMWDGVVLKKACGYIKENNATVTPLAIFDKHSVLIDATKSVLFNASKYPIGATVKIVADGISYYGTVDSVSGKTVTVGFTEDLPNFNKPADAFYMEYPPHFSYMFVAHGRLWALGVGAAGVAYRAPGESMVVYFTHHSSSGGPIDWFDEEKRIMPFLDLRSTHTTDDLALSDNLEAIAFVNDSFLFIGRNQTQIWTGSEPPGSPAAPGRQPMAYHSLVALGVPHGNLCINLPNDILMITKTGVMSVSSFNVSKQFGASSFDPIDPLVQEYVEEMVSSNIKYRACDSFKYDMGPFIGFKIGLKPVLCSLYSTEPYSWAIFTGDFESADSFCASYETLTMSVGNRIIRYADGTDGTAPVYGDDNGNGMINAHIAFPTIDVGNKRFSCKRYEILLEYFSSFIVNEANQCTLSATGDIPRSFTLSVEPRFFMKGDNMGTIPLATDVNPTEESVGFRLDYPYYYARDRFKFCASRFSVRLDLYTKDGPIHFRNVRLYGLLER